MLIYIIALAYAATSPIILPFALIYFIFSWIMWRYNILYVSERCFESGGQIWDTVFKQVCCCMFIFEFFTGQCLFVCLLTRECLPIHVCFLISGHECTFCFVSLSLCRLSVEVFIYASLFICVPPHVVVAVSVKLLHLIPHCRLSFCHLLHCQHLDSEGCDITDHY